MAKFRAITTFKNDLIEEPPFCEHKEVEIVEDSKSNSILFEESDSSKTMGFDWSPVKNVANDTNPPSPLPTKTKSPSSIKVLTNLVKDIHNDMKRQGGLLKWIFGHMNVSIRKISRLEVFAEAEAKANNQVKGADKDKVWKATNDFSGLVDNQYNIKGIITYLDAKMRMNRTKDELEEIWCSQGALK